MYVCTSRGAYVARCTTCLFRSSLRWSVATHAPATLPAVTRGAPPFVPFALGARAMAVAAIRAAKTKAARDEKIKAAARMWGCALSGGVDFRECVGRGVDSTAHGG